MNKLIIILLLLFPAATSAMDVDKIFADTNTTRSLVHVEPLKRSITLDRVAQKRLQDMRINRYFSHRSPTGQRALDIAWEMKYPFRSLGENLAMGFPTENEVVVAWVTSPSHYANLIDSDYKEIGLATDGDLVVQIFGTQTDSYGWKRAK